MIEFFYENKKQFVICEYFQICDKFHIIFLKQMIFFLNLVRVFDYAPNYSLRWRFWLKLNFFIKVQVLSSSDREFNVDSKNLIVSISNYFHLKSASPHELFKQFASRFSNRHVILCVVSFFKNRFLFLINSLFYFIFISIFILLTRRKATEAPYIG